MVIRHRRVWTCFGPAAQEVRQGNQPFLEVPNFETKPILRSSQPFFRVCFFRLTIVACQKYDLHFWPEMVPG